MRLALIGTGLIGGSAAWAMRKAGVIDAVTACDVSIASARRAMELGVADLATDSIAEAVSHADLVMVAVPVLAMGEVFEAIGRCLPAHALVTDVGSTRQTVIAAARRGLKENFERYAPVHPIAGGEMPGIDYARPTLFEGCKAISTPAEGMGEQALAFWEEAWTRIGAKVLRMNPHEHDDIFASVSHLPHVLAYALVDAIGQTDTAEVKFHLTGAGFRDFTRIAASSPAMWRDICLANREAILDCLVDFEERVHILHKAINRGDAATIEQIFQRASAARRRVAEIYKAEHPHSASGS